MLGKLISYYYYYYYYYYKTSNTCPSVKNKIIYTLLSQHKHQHHTQKNKKQSGKQPKVDC